MRVIARIPHPGPVTASRKTMYTLVLASQKGGSGKTTLAGHLAVQAQISGAGPVAIIDTDPQASLASWWKARKSRSPHLISTGLLDLGEALKALERQGFRLVVIDTPPAITTAISQVISHSDLVIIPARPSPHDLRAVGATVDLAERLAKPVIFVINAAAARARITGEAAVALSQHGTVAPVIVKNRVDFAASMVDGRTVCEIVPDSASAIEIRDLWSYVQDRLFRIMRDLSIMPEIAPRHLALTPLSALDEGDLFAGTDEEDKESETAEQPQANVEREERRSGQDRRTANGSSFGRFEHRRHHFGRRA
jgi:chromosome partitioning protein